MIKLKKLFLILKNNLSSFRIRYLSLPRWDKFNFLEKKQKKFPKVLIATLHGGHIPSSIFDSIIAKSIKIRGYRVYALLCDRSLSACMMCESRNFINDSEFIDNGPKSKCDNCFDPAKKMYDSQSTEVLHLSNFVSNDDLSQIRKILKNVSDINDIKSFKFNEINIGEHCVAGALRYYARSDFLGEKNSLKILKLYFESALFTYFAIKNIQKKYNFDVSLVNHGIYIPQGVVVDTLKKYGSRIVTWNMAYRDKSFILSHDKTYHYGLIDEKNSQWDKLKLNKIQKKEILDYLSSRKYGYNDWISFIKTPPIIDIKKITRISKIDFNKPSVCLLTNVCWDAQLHYKSNIFNNMLEWIFFTIDHFISRNDIQLIIRIHPAEKYGNVPSRQKIYDEILCKYKNIPSNIFIIQPGSNLSTYEIAKRCNATLIYGTKMGVELAPLGIPIIVCGEAWIRNKGVTIDPKTKKEYLFLLKSLPKKIIDINLIQDRALKYAYHFFFRKMIPIECVKANKGWPPFKLNIRKIDDLNEFKSVGLDIICDGILFNKDFIYPKEILKK